MSVLVIAEHHQGRIADNLAQLVTAAGRLGGEVHLLLLGQGLTEAGEQAAALTGVNRVLLAEHPMLAEGLNDGVDRLLAEVARDYQHCLMAASSQGKDLLPRVAARLGVEMIAEVTGIEGPTLSCVPSMRATPSPGWRAAPPSRCSPCGLPRSPRPGPGRSVP